MNKVILIGNLVKDAEFKELKNDTYVLNLNLAVNNSYTDSADFFYLKGFGERWKKVSEYLTKGTKISIEAHLKNNNFTDEDGYTEFRNDIIIDNLELLGSSQKQDSDEKPKKRRRR